MINLDELTIGQARQLSDIFGKTSATGSATTPSWRIVVLERGWVVVGDYSESGPEVLIENASVIRVWGTTKGLGELAANGPLAGTKLDHCGTVRSHRLAVLFTLDCRREQWK